MSWDQEACNERWRKRIEQVRRDRPAWHELLESLRIHQPALYHEYRLKLGRT